MALRKKRGGEYREVSDQIIRWRKRLKREGITIGHATSVLRAKGSERTKKRVEAKKADLAANPQKKNWFA
jgi:hypothetical protein